MRAEEFIDEYSIDNTKGVGATPNNTEIDYFGCKVEMKPSIFLALASPGGGRSLDYMVKHIQSGGAVGAPMLYVRVPDEWKKGIFNDTDEPFVDGHEGRNRMMAIQKLEGDVPVETHIIIKSSQVEWRARFITPEVLAALNKFMKNEQGTGFVMGPLFK